MQNLSNVSIDKRANANVGNDWQFPAITEKLAWFLHREKDVHADALANSNTSYYLPFPWATYIDKGDVPNDQADALRAEVEAVRKTHHPSHNAFRLHTVCQHIYWQTLLPFWREVGITDLHLSHLEPNVELADIRVHSWHLAAANVVNEDRREGLTFGKPPNTKKYLSSFIGAHMDHYRSDVRVHLKEEVTRDGFHDVLYELKGDWHFNPLVYQHQVEGRALDATQVTSERAATIRYNEVLSDSVFALCPEGAGPNTIRLWEALAIGSIPVVIVENWVWPTIPGDDLKWDDAVIHVKRDELSGLFDRLRGLRRFEPDRVLVMQRNAMEVYQRFEKKLCF